jgi:hypothetical protein
MAHSTLQISCLILYRNGGKKPWRHFLSSRRFVFPLWATLTIGSHEVPPKRTGEHGLNGRFSPHSRLGQNFPKIIVCGDRLNVVSTWPMDYYTVWGNEKKTSTEFPNSSWTRLRARGRMRGWQNHGVHEDWHVAFDYKFSRISGISHGCGPARVIRVVLNTLWGNVYV